MNKIDEAYDKGYRAGMARAYGAALAGITKIFTAEGFVEAEQGTKFNEGKLKGITLAGDMVRDLAYCLLSIEETEEKHGA